MPVYTVHGSVLAVTSEHAPITVPCASVTPGMITAFVPTFAKSSSTTGASVILSLNSSGSEAGPISPSPITHGERILIFAADEVGPVLAIDDMIALMDQGTEFVSAPRYAHGGRRLGGSWIGQLLSRTANRLLIVMSGTGLTDS